MQLIKAILKFAEGKPDANPVACPDIPGYTTEQVTYHVGLCAEAGYIKASATMDATYIRYLTWNGHEALDGLRQAP